MNSRSLVLFTCLAPSIVFAQGVNLSDTTSLSTVIISENRLQIPFNKQSRNIQIIDKQEIQRLPVRSINEVLSYLNGIDVRQRGPFGTQADISIDGGLFDQTLILLNGVKISDIQTGHHSMNIPVSLDAVERIEVLRGPAARVYGINALTGAINIITSVSQKDNLTLNVQAGSSFKSKDEGDGKGIYAGTSVQAIGQVGTANFRNLISLAYGKSNGIRYNSNTEDVKLFYQSKYNWNPNNGLDVMLGYIDNQFGANGYYASPGDKESFEIVKTFISAVGSQHRLSERFVLKPRLSYRFNKDDYRYFKNDLSKARSQHETNALSVEINSMLHTAVGDFGFGVESRSEEILSSNIGTHQRYNHGFFAEYKNESVANLYFNVGGYVNYNTQYGWQVFPGIDASYTFLDALKASLNIGSSQRLPSYTDLYLKQPKNIGNANLVPEDAWQYELALRYFRKNAHVQVGYFNRTINQFIDWVADSPALVFQSQNLGNNKIQGWHVNAGYKHRLASDAHLQLDASYNHLNPKNKVYTEGVTSKYILESLKHQAIFRIQYFQRKLNVALANHWVERELNDPYFIADAKIGYTFNQWNVYVDINNIFDQSYKEIGTILLPGRWFSLGVKWTLHKL